MRAKSLALGLLAAGLMGASAAPPSPGTALNVAACPIVRDTSPAPCWLIRAGGRLYYLGTQTDISSAFYPPQLGHQALVEGVVTDRTRCGGVVLDPVKVSPLKPLAPACRERLPAAGYSTPWAERGSGPSTRKPGPRPPQVLPDPPPPYAARTVVIGFDFDSDFVNVRNAMALGQAAALARASHARVSIVGRRGVTRLSDGRELVEGAGIGRRRAEKAALFLKDQGVAPEAATVEWREAPEGGPGQAGAQARTVTLQVTPPTAP